MGHGHEICEDYAVSGSSYVLIADGCSSAANSDVGARLLVHRAKHVINYYNKELLENYDRFGNSIISWAKSYSESMGLPKSSLDATLLAAFVLEDNLVIRIYGDGVFQVNLPGRKETCVVNYPLEKPYYLSYKLSPKNTALLIAKQPVKTIKTYTEIDGKISTEEKEVLSTDPCEFIFPVDSVLQALIASDGVGTFYSEDEGRIGDSINVLEVLNTLTAFKVYTKGFVLRRLRKAEQKWVKNSIKHYDDISLGVLKWD